MQMAIKMNAIEMGILLDRRPRLLFRLTLRDSWRTRHKALMAAGDAELEALNAIGRSAQRVWDWVTGKKPDTVVSQLPRAKVSPLGRQRLLSR